MVVDLTRGALAGSALITAFCMVCRRQTGRFVPLGKSWTSWRLGQFDAKVL